MLPTAAGHPAQCTRIASVKATTKETANTWQWGEAGYHVARAVHPHLQITEMESGNLSIVQRRCNENTIDAGLFKRPEIGMISNTSTGHDFIRGA